MSNQKKQGVIPASFVFEGKWFEYYSELIMSIF